MIQLETKRLILRKVKKRDEKKLNKEDFDKFAEELKLNKKEINLKLLSLKDILKKDFWIACITWGGFCDFDKNSKNNYKYKIVLIKKTKYTLLHEMIHIKLNHLEKQKEKGLHLYNIIKCKPYEIECNKKLKEYDFLIK